MKVDKKMAAVLGLSVLEQKVLSVLETKGSLSMQELSDKVGAPRTTVYWPLTRLHKRGLVGYNTIGKRKRWHSALEHAAILGKNRETELIRGVDSMRRLYNQLLLLGRNERVIFVEGKRAIHAVAEKAGIEFMTHWHTRAHEKRIIIESVISKTTFEEIASHKVRKRVVESLARWETWIGHVVPDELLNPNTAVVIYPHGAIIADWDNEQALHITQPEFVSTLRKMRDMHQILGEKKHIVAHTRTAASRS
jgi:predicted transcriptional regulator